jgi:hypothetical protein
MMDATDESSYEPDTNMQLRSPSYINENQFDMYEFMDGIEFDVKNIENNEQEIIDLVSSSEDDKSEIEISDGDESDNEINDMSISDIEAQIYAGQSTDTDADDEEGIPMKKLGRAKDEIKFIVRQDDVNTMKRVYKPNELPGTRQYNSLGEYLTSTQKQIDEQRIISLLNRRKQDKIRARMYRARRANKRNTAKGKNDHKKGANTARPHCKRARTRNAYRIVAEQTGKKSPERDARDCRRGINDKESIEHFDINPMENVNIEKNALMIAESLGKRKANSIKSLKTAMSKMSNGPLDSNNAKRLQRLQMQLQRRQSNRNEYMKYSVPAKYEYQYYSDNDERFNARDDYK